jgi:tetratricopeptide (TPR) repeat protein
MQLGTRLAAGNPPDVGAQFAIGAGRLIIGRGEEANGNFQKAIAEFQQLGSPNMALAHALAVAGRRKEAIEMFAKIPNPAQNGYATEPGEIRVIVYAPGSDQILETVRQR